MMSTAAYRVAKISIVRSCFCRYNLLQIFLFTTCHSFSGESKFMKCTRTASKIAWQTICKGLANRSSSSVTAGYLLRGIGSSMSTGRCTATPFLVRTVTVSTNMNFFHWSHHTSIVERSPSKLLMTVGRQTGGGLYMESTRVTTLIVFVTRSGIEMSRFAPSFLSLINSETMRRFASPSPPSSPCHMSLSRTSRPSHSSTFKSSMSSANMLSVNTELTSQSSSSGASRKHSTPFMRSMYAGSW
mmetsp:Transcript_90820/g.256517  ORF Transcript_90820/g.256517 Transcript_90820/m.256517 type:complete len:243 (+) Transcript_90820:810-1538(+)